MGSGMKKVTMTMEQVAFFYGILNNPTLCPMKDLESMRKITRVFDAVEDFANTYRDESDKIKKANGKVLYSRDKDGEMVKVMNKFNEPVYDVPQASMSTFNKEIEPLQNKKVVFLVERNDLEFIKLLVADIPKKAYKEGDEDKPTQGIGGRHESRLISDIMTALEDSVADK